MSLWRICMQDFLINILLGPKAGKLLKEFETKTEIAHSRELSEVNAWELIF